MKQFDETKYKEIHAIANEILEAIKQGGDVSSCEKMLDFLPNEVARRAFLERITSEELYMQYRKERQGRNKERDVQLLIEHLEAEKRKKRGRRKMYIRFVSAAVAAVFVLFISIPRLIDKEEIPVQETNTVQVAQVEKPTLFLDNGVKLELQDLEVESLGEQYGVKEVASNRVVFRKPTESDEIKYNTLIIPAGYNYNAKLADGTEVTLNAGSRLKYAISGKTNKREVELEGEAYFKVSKSTEPFIVKMGDGTSVKVYGTEFNACKDKNGDIEVVLVKGSVGFNSTRREEVMLKPNQRCDYDSEGGQVNVVDVDVRSYIAWMHNEFNYEQVPLDYFLKKVAVWYGVEFKYEKERLEAIEFYISTTRDIALDDLLLLIEKSTNLCIAKESNHVFTIK